MCMICEHYGEDKKAEEQDSIYYYNKEIKLALCRNHSIELFKNGQNKFLLKHCKLVESVVGSNNPKLMKVLEDTYRKKNNLTY